MAHLLCAESCSRNEKATAAETAAAYGTDVRADLFSLEAIERLSRVRCSSELNMLSASIAAALACTPALTTTRYVLNSLCEVMLIFSGEELVRMNAFRSSRAGISARS